MQIVFPEVSEKFMQLLQKVIQKEKQSYSSASSLLAFGSTSSSPCVRSGGVSPCPVPAKHAEKYSREDPFVGMCAIQRKLNARLRSCRAWEFEDQIFRCVSFFLVNRAC